MQNAARFLQGKTPSNWRFPIDFPSTKINLESPGSQPEPLLKADAPDGVYWEEQLLGSWGQWNSPAELLRFVATIFFYQYPDGTAMGTHEMVMIYLAYGSIDF